MLAPRAHGRVALVATENGADAAATSAALPRAALPQLPQRRHPSRNSVMTHLDNRAIMLYVTVVTGKRNAMLADKAVQDCIVAAWKAAADWLVGRYVIMPDHIHFFCAPATYPPPDFHRWMKQWKAQVSRSFPIGLRAGRAHGRVALVATGNGADAAHGRVALSRPGTARMRPRQARPSRRRTMRPRQARPSRTCPSRARLLCFSAIAGTGNCARAKAMRRNGNTCATTPSERGWSPMRTSGRIKGR